MLDGSLSAKATKSACCALWRKVRVSLPTDTDPPGFPGHTGDPAMHDIPLRFADVVGAVLIGCAFGALLVAFL